MSEYMVQKYILSICKNTLPFIPEKNGVTMNLFMLISTNTIQKCSFFTLMPIIMIYLTC